MKKLLYLIASILALFLFLGTSVVAQGIEIRQTDFISQGPEELSAVEVITDDESVMKGTYLLAADDKKTPLLIIDAKSGKVINNSLSTPEFGQVQDWEAMAKDEKFYYVAASNLSVFRFRLELNQDPGKIKIVDAKRLTATKTLNDFKELIRPELEGLAVSGHGTDKQLIFGVREHVDSVIPPKTAKIRVLRAQLSGESQTTLDIAKYFEFDAETTQVINWHLSSIEYVPEWRGFLVMTSTENKGAPAGNRLWFIDDKSLGDSKRPGGGSDYVEVRPVTSQPFEPTMKAEGLAVFPKSTTQGLRIVITYDNDYKYGTVMPQDKRLSRIQIRDIDFSNKP